MMEADQRHDIGRATSSWWPATSVLRCRRQSPAEVPPGRARRARPRRLSAYLMPAGSVSSALESPEREPPCPTQGNYGSCDEPPYAGRCSACRCWPRVPRRPRTRHPSPAFRPVRPERLPPRSRHHRLPSSVGACDPCESRLSDRDHVDDGADAREIGGVSGDQDGAEFGGGDRSRGRPATEASIRSIRRGRGLRPDFRTDAVMAPVQLRAHGRKGSGSNSFSTAR